MVNEVRLIGRLGKDPEGFDTKDGRGARMSIATSSYSGGEERTEWHRVVVFGKAAGFVLDYLGKGRLVYVEGRLQTSSYEKDGVKRYSTDVISYRVTSLEKPPEGATKNDSGATFTDDAAAEDVPF